VDVVVVVDDRSIRQVEVGVVVGVVVDVLCVGCVRS